MQSQHRQQAQPNQHQHQAAKPTTTTTATGEHFDDSLRQTIEETTSTQPQQPNNQQHQLLQVGNSSQSEPVSSAGSSLVQQHQQHNQHQHPLPAKQLVATDSAATRLVARRERPQPAIAGGVSDTSGITTSETRSISCSTSSAAAAAATTTAISQNSTPQPPPASVQGIKVTLSAPRNSSIASDQQQPAEPPQELPVLLEPTSPSLDKPPPPPQADPQPTAALIEGPAEECAVPLGGGGAAAEKGDTTTVVGGGDPAGHSKDRTRQESELRRIAAERVANAKPTRQQRLLLLDSEQQPVPLGASPALEWPKRPPFVSASPEPLASPVKLSGATVALAAVATTAEQGNNLGRLKSPKSPKPVSEPPNPKQLAIYINGKIRSNSIFCRSASSNSFNSILNRRFHHHNGQNNSNSTGQLVHQQSELLVTCDKESPLRLCQPQPTKCASKRIKIKGGSSQPSDPSCTPSSSARQLVANLRSSARNLFASYLGGGSGASDKKELATDSGAGLIQVTKSTSLGSERPTIFGGGAGGGECLSTSADEGSAKKQAADGNRAENRHNHEHGGGDNDDIDDDDDEEEEEDPANKASYKLNPSSMFLRKAMRYYRLWIYCTNITILLGTLIFILSAIYVTSDFRIRLLLVPSSSSSSSLLASPSPSTTTTQPRAIGDSGGGGSGEHHTNSNNNNSGNDNTNSNNNNNNGIQVSLTEPCVLLAFFIIALQAGVLQAIGCFGAVRMKERWIQAFWYLILALTVFDMVFLVYWLNRYDLIVKSLRHHMTSRLSHQYGGHHSQLGTITTPQETNFKFDKTLTEIIDKIQANSQCCGISSSLDFRTSKWRQMKLAQLSARLNWTDARSIDLLRRVPLVPASCCRRADDQQPPQQQPHDNGWRHASRNKRPVIPAPLDDTQLGRPPNVPAWSPSMVVEDLQVRQRANRLLTGGRSPDETHDYDDDAREPPGDDDQQDNVDVDEEPSMNPSSEGLSYQQRRRLAKQGNFGKQQPSTIVRRSPRWTVESRVDDEQRVLAWLADHDDDDDHHVAWEALAGGNDVGGGNSGGDRHHELVTDYAHNNNNSNNGSSNDYSSSNNNNKRRNRLASLRRILFKRHEGEGSDGLGRSNFEHDNKLQLSFEQYKTIESYLLDERDSTTRAASLGAGTGGERKENYGAATDDGTGNGNGTPPSPFAQRKRLQARSILSSLLSGGSGSGQHTATTTAGAAAGSLGAPTTTNGQSDGGGGDDEALIRRRRDELAAALKLDPETSCAPRSDYDRAAIYTRGCQPAIKSWLDSSAHILFVTGFCILTVLKFCSVVLLRLEIREMIHKIRVLKGMATEYNALHDLEAYLPRPSVCAQAAELTASGVAAALPQSAGGGAGGGGGSCGAGQQQPGPVQRLGGGSFSETVAAATAAAAAAAGSAGASNQVSGQLSLGSALGSNSSRAVSMKAFAAMLAPPLYPTRSTSATSPAHLAAGSLLGQRQAFSLKSDSFQASSVMSRRHTAISVCPAAAAAAAAAAHHLMSRRGTYVANPLFNTAPIQPRTMGAVSAASAGPPASSSSSNPLGHHRHSAHIVPTIDGAALFNHPPTSRSPATMSSSAGAGSGCSGGHKPPPTTTSMVGGSRQRRPTAATDHLSGGGGPASSVEHQSSVESTTAAAGAGQQLLSLMYPFKRQSSSGAQSAGNFSLDLSPSLMTVSRRSIH